MMKKLYLFFILVCTILIIQGCSEPQRPRYIPQFSPAIIAPEIQYVSADLIVGKTRKSEILKALGNPENASESSLTYDYKNPLSKAKIRYIQKDGTEFIVILGKGESKRIILLHFNDNGILRNVSFL